MGKKSNQTKPNETYLHKQTNVFHIKSIRVALEINRATLYTEITVDKYGRIEGKSMNFENK